MGTCEKIGPGCSFGGAILSRFTFALAKDGPTRLAFGASALCRSWRPEVASRVLREGADLGGGATNVSGSLVSLPVVSGSARAASTRASPVSFARSGTVPMVGIFSACSWGADDVCWANETASRGIDAEVLTAICAEGECRTPFTGNSTPATAPIPALSATIGMPTLNGTRSGVPRCVDNAYPQRNSQWRSSLCR
jgi:hypothetical protein